MLAIDAGQTGMKVRVTAASRTTDDLVFEGIRTHEPLLPQLAEVARAAIVRCGADARHPHRGHLRTDGPGCRCRRRCSSSLRDTGIRRGGARARLHDIVPRRARRRARRGRRLGHGRRHARRGPGRDRPGRRLGLHHGRRGQRVLDRARGARRRDAGVRRPRSRRRPHRRGPRALARPRPRRTSTCRPRRTGCSIVASFAAHGRAARRRAATGSPAGSPRRRAASSPLSVSTALERVAHPDDDRFTVCAMGGVFRSPLLREAFAACARREGGRRRGLARGAARRGDRRRDRPCGPRLPGIRSSSAVHTATRPDSR